jgi:1-acyl-sn-glycerol-3-phosphate acyltransferase
MFKTILFNIAMYMWLIIWAPFVLAGLLSLCLTKRFNIIMARGLLLLARLIVGIKWEVVDTVPGRGCKTDPKHIIASKHMSILEIAIIMVTFQNAFFIMKREMLFIPVYGWAFWRLGFVPVDRTKGATNMKELCARVARRIEKGGTLAIFPEGTRKKPGDMVKLRGGLFYMASFLRLSIQPVGTNAGLFWPKRGRMQGGIAKIWLEPPLPFDAPADAVAAAIGRHSV